jgi:methylase of polypeptide subunit release factors
MTQTDYRTSGSLDSFESDWERALANPEARWFSYPQHPPTTQTELFEWVKAQQIDALLASHAPPGGRVLEYGCGSAGMSIYLANRGYETFSVDLAFDALRVARLNAEKHGSPPRFYRVCSDTFKLPFVPMPPSMW